MFGVDNYAAVRRFVFVEGRNLTDKRYASTVIAAENNLGGVDASTFVPGEGRAFTFGVESRF